VTFTQQQAEKFVQHVTNYIAAPISAFRNSAGCTNAVVAGLTVAGAVIGNQVGAQSAAGLAVETGPGMVPAAAAGGISGGIVGGAAGHLAGTAAAGVICSSSTNQGGGSADGGKNGWTNKIAREKAEELGYKEVKGAPFNSRNQLTFKSGNRWITPDIDGHTGYQSWKVFDSSGNRLGTYNTDLTVRLGK
jgi:hypothetical protein